MIFAPLSIFGGLLAAAIGLLVARGFGTPLVIWAWPILFVGLGLDFLRASFLPGGVANIVVGIVFVVMGLVPLVVVVRVGAARLLVGTTNAHDRPFRDGRGPTPIFHVGRAGDEESAVPATARDWALALGVSVPSVIVGVWLGPGPVPQCGRRAIGQRPRRGQHQGDERIHVGAAGYGTRDAAARQRVVEVEAVAHEHHEIEGCRILGVRAQSVAPASAHVAQAAARRTRSRPARVERWRGSRGRAGRCPSRTTAGSKRSGPPLPGPSR